MSPGTRMNQVRDSEDGSWPRAIHNPRSPARAAEIESPGTIGPSVHSGRAEFGPRKVSAMPTEQQRER